MHSGSARPEANLGAAHLPRTRAQLRRMRSKLLQNRPITLNCVRFALVRTRGQLRTVRTDLD